MYTKHVLCVHMIRKYLSNIHQSNRYNDTLNVKRSYNLRAKVALKEDKQFVLILYAFNNITVIKIVKEIKSMVPIILLTRRKANRYRKMRIEETARSLLVFQVTTTNTRLCLASLSFSPSAIEHTYLHIVLQFYSTK